MQEFFAQGDLEKSLQLPCQPFMDRENAGSSPAKAQRGFIKFLAQPLFEAFIDFAPRCAFMRSHIEFNLKELGVLIATNMTSAEFLSMSSVADAGPSFEDSLSTVKLAPIVDCKT